LGQSGLEISEIGLGCNNFGVKVDAQGTQRIVDAAIDHGINFFDTADVYGNHTSEECIGKALRGRRDSVLIATKFGMPMGEERHLRGGSRRYIRFAVEASLRRLGTDYIDLYQMHQPDPKTPIQETLSVLDDLVHEGKIRYIGSSNFSGWQIADAAWQAQSNSLTTMVSAQNHYSLLERKLRHEVLPACDHFGVGQLPYFPLASGMLTGKYRANEAPPEHSRLALVQRLAKGTLTPDNFSLVTALTEYCASQDKPLLNLAFGWLLSQPLISSVIAGATSVEQLTQNVAAGLDWRLDAAQMRSIDEILSGKT
jgi:aryl-alcohol dehydrogenase-like predicted oxidoreductase